MKLPCIQKIVFNKNKPGNGFRLINLLVICGILAGNTSSVLSQVSNASAVEGEAKTYVGSMLRAEQAFYLENGVYTTSIPELGLGLPSDTYNYRYSISSSKDTYEPKNDFTIPGVTIIARPHGVVRINGITTGPGSNNKAVIGGVATITTGGYVTSISKICTAILTPKQGGRLGTDLMIFTSTGLICPRGYK